MSSYLTALLFVFYFDSETISGIGGLCFEGNDKKGRQLFLRKKCTHRENPGYALDSG